jgi:hypothetical protein
MGKSIRERSMNIFGDKEMIKKLLLSILCLSWLPAQAANPVVDFEFGDAGIISGSNGSFHMHSVAVDNKPEIETLLVELKKDSTNPSMGIGMVDVNVKRRLEEGNPYHMMVFSHKENTEIFSVMAQGPMPVFGYAAGNGYNAVDHAAVIAKWKDLGVRRTVGEGEGAHDERVENFGLLNFVPLIDPSVDGETHTNIYLSMVNLARQLRTSEELMKVENNHKLECTDRALPNHIVMLLHPEFRDLSLLESLPGFVIDRNPGFEKFYNVPRVMVTYDLTQGLVD